MDTVSGDVTLYDCDALGNLLEVVLHEGQANERVIAYKVDGQGRRVQKRVDGVVAESYLYAQGLLPVAQLDASGNVVSVFGPGFMKQGGQTYAVLTDHLGSPRMVVNAATGAIVQRLEYDEFGRVLLDSITPDIQGYKALPFGFAGGLYDRDTNLVRFGARDYDPEVGRWTTKDPILFAGGDGNLYGYCVNDPVNFADPTGLYVPAILAAAGIGFEIGMSIWDWWDAGKTVLDPCKTGKEKTIAVGLAAAGMVGPGGGYGHADDLAKAARNLADQRALRDLINEATQRGRKPLSSADKDTILDWAREINYPGVRAQPGDLASPSNWTANPVPHIHVPGAGRGGHVPVD